MTEPLNEADQKQLSTDLKRREMLKKLATMSAYTAPTVTILLSSSSHGHSTASGALENYSTIASCANDPTSMNLNGNMNHPQFGNPPMHCQNKHGL